MLPTRVQELHQPFDASSCNLSVINAIDDPSQQQFSVFPNPVDNEFNVKGDWNNATFAVIDATGRTALLGNLNAVQTTVSVASLPSGIYFLEIAENV